MKHEEIQLIHGLANKITAIEGKSKKIKKAIQGMEVSNEVEKLIELTEEASQLIRSLKNLVISEQ